MTKKQKKIMIWMIVWAGLLILVLYSPIGSPDLYSSSGYYISIQDVSTDKSTILNAPKGNLESDSYSDDAGLPDLSSALKSNYSMGSAQSGSIRSQGSSYPVQTQSYQNNNSSGSGQGMGGSSFLASGGSHGSAASSGISMTTGQSTLSLTTNLSNNSITKQNSIAYTADTGGTDPGGDPTGNPIPVGNGWGILLFFGAIYTAFKVFEKRKYNALNQK